MKWLPNALTILRCILAFVVGWAILAAQFGNAIYYGPNCHDIGIQPKPVCRTETLWAGWPIIVFIVAALLDYLDGLAARLLNAATAFGAWLDPIADKLLVGVTLMALVISSKGNMLFLIPAVIIISRDLWVTAMRGRVAGGIPVSLAAKWKTGIAMTALGGILLFERPFETGIPIDLAGVGAAVSLLLLYLAAALSLYTGYQYVRAAFSKPAP